MRRGTSIAPSPLVMLMTKPGTARAPITSSGTPRAVGFQSVAIARLRDSTASSGSPSRGEVAVYFEEVGLGRPGEARLLGHRTNLVPGERVELFPRLPHVDDA